jgi:heterodisulfide reductase, subunit A
MILPLTPASAQDAAPTANVPVANAPVTNTPTPATQDVADEPSFTVVYEDYYYQDGRDVFMQEGDGLYTGEDSKITVLGSGFTKEWREQHGKVVIYIAPEENVPYNALQITDTLLRFEEGKDFTIDDDGTFVAPLKVEANTLPSYYTLTEYFPDMTLDKVRYEVGILAEPEGQPQSTVQDIWARKNVVTHHGLSTNDYHFDTFAPKLKYDALKDTTKDQELLIQGQGFVGTDIPGVEGMMYVIREKGTGSPVLVMSEMKRYVHGDDEYETGLEGGFAFVNLKIPANTLDPSKQYVIEAWSDYGYPSKTDKTLITPMVGFAPEHRGVLLAHQDLKFEGVQRFTNAYVPVEERMYFSTSLNDEEQKQPATRGELASALYEMKGSPKVDLPEVSPWPDVKTDNPNYAAYIWAREKGVTFGGPDGKFHAEDGLTNATVAAMIYRASGSPEVSGVSSFPDVTPDSAFYREILWATQQNVITPETGMFEPNHAVTRIELDWMLFYYRHRVMNPITTGLYRIAN